MLDGFIASLSVLMAAVFLLIVISYYLLLFLNVKKAGRKHRFSSITVIIPAHNEEEYIAESIRSVINAEFEGKKDIIVVDDGSADQTAKIASSFKEVKLIRVSHSGKASALNAVLKVAEGEVVAVVDGDSFIGRNSLQAVVSEVERFNVVAASCPVGVRNRKKFVCMWLHLVEIYFSLIRFLFSKINANITTPGPLSAYRKKELVEIGGFSSDGFSEDADVAIRLIRKGYKIGFAENTMVETNMPSDLRGFISQRARFARGMIYLLRKHMKLNLAAIDVYTLPIFFFFYAQSVIMGSLTLYQVISGYFQYFYSQGLYLNFEVLRFFFDWFSLIGFLKWTLNVFLGNSPLTLIAGIGILSSLLSYPLYVLAILKFDKKITILHIIPFMFMFPFWLFLMFIQILCIPEMFSRKQRNIWKKNE